MDSIPTGQPFDLVVGNPPHFPAAKGKEKSLLRDDIAFALHKFYKDIPPYLKA